MISPVPVGATIMFAVSIAFALIDWNAVWLGRRRVEYVAKPATLAALLASVVLVVMADPPVVVSTTETTWFVGALALSLVGDVALMVWRDNIIPGLLAFLLSHIAYIVGLNTLAISDTWVIPVALVAVAAIALGVLKAVFGWFADRPERPALFAYVAVIAIMVASAWTLPLRTGVPIGSAIAGIVGASLFFLSDSMIAKSRFVSDFPRSQFWIMTTYHLAQYGLVLSLFAGT